MSGGGGGNGSGRDDNFTSPRQPRQSVQQRPGGGGAGGGGGGGAAADPCDIVQTATLNSPNPIVIPWINVNDRLDVVLGGTPTRPILEVRKPQPPQDRAGSLTHRGHLQIIDCIADGNLYVAIVTHKSGGMVTVRIQRA